MTSLADVLGAVARFVRRFVVLTPQQYDAIALWVAHTHAFSAAATTPYLRISSAAMQSGKTRLLEVLQFLVARPWFTGRVSPAVLVRKVADQCPTLLLDETDAAFGSGEEYAEALRGVLNTGHRRGGQVSICVNRGTNITYPDFSTFAPKALAGLKRLPDTVEDRSIPIRLKRRDRRASSETVEKFRLRKVEVDAAPLRQWLEGWAQSVVEILRDADPELPDDLSDRACDGWEPLINIADRAGGDWPARARLAALALSASGTDDETNLGIHLLADTRRAFAEHQLERIASASLIEIVCEDDAAPWGDWHGKRLTPQALARLLGPFGIRPRGVRIGDKTPRGYYREDFEDAWSRYLPSPSALDQQHPQHFSLDAGSSHFSDQQQPPCVAGRENPEDAHGGCIVAGVADDTPSIENRRQPTRPRILRTRPARRWLCVTSPQHVRTTVRRFLACRGEPR